MQRAIRWFMLLVVISSLVGYAGKFSDPLDPDGKDKKVTSGISFKKETRVEALASPSLTAPGWDAERVWSGFDDWEPAIATDPSSNYVYQMTTRYNGPSACNGCPFPIVVIRVSSDGGTTWGPDKIINVSKKKQNDPEVEVATDGSVYALWLDSYTPGVKFTKSTNRGATWSAPKNFVGSG